MPLYKTFLEKAMAPLSRTLAWKIPWMEEPGRLQSMGSLRVGHDWATSLSLFTFMHCRRKWQPTPVFWRIWGTGEPGGLLSMGLRRVGHDWSDVAVAAQDFLGEKLQEGKLSESVELRWMNLEPVIQSEVNQKQKNKYRIFTTNCGKFWKTWEYQTTWPAS